MLVERFSAEGRPERYSDMAREVVSHQPDAILTIGTPLTREFKKATSRIPIVSITADPVQAGLVESYVSPWRERHGHEQRCQECPFGPNVPPS